MYVMENVLNHKKLREIRGLLNKVKFIDGKATAKAVREGVKNNIEADIEDPMVAKIREAVAVALSRHDVFLNYALPHKVRMPILSCYRPGMAYGNHLDMPLMGAGPIHSTRTDLSYTIFLSDPETYEGGELVIQTELGEHKFKLPAGHGVIYPTTYIHRVAEVTKGERRAVVNWLQSRVPDHDNRAVLYDVALALRDLPKDADGEQGMRLQHIYTRLFQKWVVI